MKPHDFARYVQHMTRHAHPAMLDDEPRVEMFDGMVRIFDQRSESMTIRHPFARCLRQLAFQLELHADEIERRGFETVERP